MKLVNALRTKDTTTSNGMSTNSTTLNMCVDAFYTLGSMRGKDKNRKINIFIKAFNEDSLTAMKILFWVRDIRGGAGERETFKQIIRFLANKDSNSILKNIELIPEYGRWDDLLSLFGTKLEDNALELIKEALVNKNQTCAKWMPRGVKSNAPKINKINASKIRNYLGLTPKEYRKLLSGLSKTTEQLMCSNKFSEIDYSKVPSKAMSDYMSAFSKRDTVRFGDYLNSLSNGDVKINTGAVYPYDIIKNLKFGNSEGASAQWDSLPNYLTDNSDKILPLVDVSGSMSCSVGGNENLSCLDVAISLGLYISERNEGDFKDAFMTFSSRPNLEVLNGNLEERYHQLSDSDWGMNTNIEAVFKTLLTKARKNNVSNDDMPNMILILSDMEFDVAQGYGGSKKWNPTVQELINKMYEDSGYDRPSLVYWNLNASNTKSPVSFHETGTALISGFSPTILKGLLSGEDMTPISMMKNVIDSERYSKVVI